MTQPVVEIRNFSLIKGDFKLRNISCRIYRREVFALLGKTGSGKTLLLESIAGFYRGAEGAVFIGSRPVLDIPLTERKIGFVYQDYGLFPHLTVAQNIVYGLKQKKRSRAEIEKEVLRMSGLLSITHILKQYPGTLSGGERQRTALARALVLAPDILLLDEPFSALDPVTKKTMHKELQEIHEAFGCAIIFVTHDFNEAQLLADRVGVIDDGCLKAIRNKDTLFDLYEDDTINRFFGLKE